MFRHREVRKECSGFDVVLPNCDAVSGSVFSKINRPHPRLDSSSVIRGLAAFRKEYNGALWLEIFIVPGVNDTPGELKALAGAVRAINPDIVQLNTLDRPGTCEWVRPATGGELRKIAGAFNPFPVEIITKAGRDAPPPVKVSAKHESLRSLVARRPSTINEIAAMTGLTFNEASKCISSLTDAGLITVCTAGGRTFYRASDPSCASER
jgi:wyosine [tRNA(Phe)-imidazoG37] synthetase (radical SAM superfamily)